MARVPLDVDLEDRLIYGLSPQRFGYLLIFVLAAFATWSRASIPVPGRAGLIAILMAAGAAAAWGRLNGRPLDAWVADLGRFLICNYRVELAPGLARLANWSHRSGSAVAQGVGQGAPEAPAGPRRLAITATAPGVGLTTVAVEVGASLALAGARVGIVELGPGWSHPGLRLGMLGPGCHPSTGMLVGDIGDSDQLDFVLTVLPPGSAIDNAELVVVVSPDDDRSATRTQVPIRWLVNRPSCPLPVRGREAAAPTVILEDQAIRLAQEAREAAVVAWPRSPASRTVRELAFSLLA